MKLVLFGSILCLAAVLPVRWAFTTNYRRYLVTHQNSLTATEATLTVVGFAMLLVGILSLVGGIAMAAASADPTVGVTAVCGGKNDKWVTVTVDAPPEAVVIGYWGGAGPRQTGNRFVPNAGGGNAAGDYDIDIRFEVWDIPFLEGHRVLATGEVHTPNCYSPKLVTTVPK